jgi:hypothetical protein
MEINKKLSFWRKEWDKIKFVNHGMGLFTEDEHKKLIMNGSITCREGIDSIHANYPFVKITKSNGEDSWVDVGGNRFQAEQEVLSLQRQAKKASVAYETRAWNNFMEEKSKVVNELDSLIKDFGGQVVA